MTHHQTYHLENHSDNAPHIGQRRDLAHSACDRSFFHQPTDRRIPMLTATTGTISANSSTANSNDTYAEGPRAMDTELVKRGIRATKIGVAALEDLFRREIESIRHQLDELQRSIDSGKPTEFVRRFGLARQIANSASMPEVADQLANDLLYDDPYYAHALELTLWPLLGIAAGIEEDAEFELKSHIRQMCHGGAFDLEEETERAMFEAAGLPYKRPVRIVPRCVARDVYVADADEADDEADDGERRAG